VHLVKGNHDILEEKWYSDAEITVSVCQHHVKNFSFVHDISTNGLKQKKGHYVFSGHLHPGVSISGRGRQSLHFPCFYFSKKYCVLPAFSRFTGTYRVQPKEGEKVFAITEKDILPL
jgi:metallophosphoesterase superfamily enzyme